MSQPLPQPAQTAQPTTPPEQPAPPAGGAAPNRTRRTALGILAGAAAALAGAAIYAAVLRYTGHEPGYLSLIVGALVGIAVGLVGRRFAAPRTAIALSVLGVLAGQFAGLAWLLAHQQAGLSFGTALFGHFPRVFTDWQHRLGVQYAAYYVIAAIDGFVFTRRLAARL